MIHNAKRHRRSAVGARAIERDSSARAGWLPHSCKTLLMPLAVKFGSWDINDYVRMYQNVTDFLTGDIRTTAGGGVDSDAQCNPS
jgi:hypothetical protein